MGIITNLFNRIDTLVQSSDISIVKYDRLDSINEDSANNYPLLLFRVNRTTSDNYRNKRENPIIEVDFYLSDLYYQGNSDEVYEVKDRLDEELNKVLKSINDANFNVLGVSSAEFGWEQHNDNLVVVKRTVSIQAFNCTTLIE